MGEMVLKEERTGIEKKFFDLCLKIAQEESLAIYDLDYIPGSKSLKVFVVNQGTRTAIISDCIKIDKALTPYFETEDWMPETILLEVSSPGLFRQLNSIDHFKNVAGEKVALNLIKKLSVSDFPEIPKMLARDKKIIGTLKSTNENGIELAWENFTCFIPFTNIKKANLESDLSEKE